MKHIIERRVLSADKLRGLCIMHDWCDRMTNEKYGALLWSVDKIEDGSQCSLSTSDIAEMALTIMSATSPENIVGYDLTDVMFVIADQCHTIFELDEEVDA